MKEKQSELSPAISLCEVTTAIRKLSQGRAEGISITWDMGMIRQSSQS